MIYGAINHNNSFFDRNLLRLKGALGCGGLVFSENYLPEFVVGRLGEENSQIDNHYYFDQSTNWSIFVWGRIYNITDLAENADTTISVPELLLSQFYLNGLSFPENLNGDFFIIISNPEKKTTYVFRDHLGVMPFSYTVLNNILFFSSDTLSLCRAFYSDEPVDPEFLLSEFKFTDNSLSPNNKVKRLLPGHYLIKKENFFEQHKYWFPERIKTDNSYTAERVFSEASALIHDAVKIRIEKGLETACHISGGLDSSTLAVLIKYHYPEQKNLRGFSWSPDFKLFSSQGNRDERFLFLKICNENQIEPVLSSFSQADYDKYFNFPLTNSYFFQEQIIQEFSQKNGIQLIFSGYGGDEFVSCGTYGVFIDLLKSLKWNKYWKVAKKWAFSTILKSIFLDFLFPVMGILPLSYYSQNQDSKRYIKKPFKKDHRPSLKNFFLHKSRKDMHLGMLYNYHIPLRTEEWYNWGSRHDVQYRYPLLDKRIVEFMLKIPSDYLYQESFGRMLLREVAKGILPEDVRWSTSKIDLSISKYREELQEKFYLDHFFEYEDFKKNPALAFFDFRKYEKAVLKEKKTSDLELHKSIISTFIQLKWVHEFSKQYAITP